MTTSASARTAGSSLERGRPAGVLGGEPVGALAGAVDHDDLGGAARRDGRGGQPGHGTGADHGDPAARDVAAVAGGPVEGRADQRRCGAVDVGLGARALADPQRLLEQHVEGRADGAELLAEPERVAGLAEDLALADGHRVEPGRDLEQVRDRAVVVVDVEVREHRRRWTCRTARSAAGRAPRPSRGTGRRRRRSRPGCRSRCTVASVTCSQAATDWISLGTASASGRDLLQQGHRGGVVGDADHEDAHDAVTSPCLRCSW